MAVYGSDRWLQFLLRLIILKTQTSFVFDDKSSLVTTPSVDSKAVSNPTAGTVVLRRNFREQIFPAYCRLIDHVTGSEREEKGER